MTIDPYILTFSALTVVVTVWMGFWAARKSKTASDFYVAGRTVSVGWNASAISGEYLSAASFMGVAGMVMSSGYDALWYPVCYACGYLFLLLFIAGPLRRFGAYTIPDFAEGRYDSTVFRKIAVVFVLFIGFFYTMPQMKGAGTTLAYIFPGLPYWAGVVLVGAVITLNVALGGMKGITLVQAFQYWAKMFAISVPVFVLMAVYGHYGKQLSVNGKLEHRTANLEPRIASTNDGDQFKAQDSEFMVESSELLKALAEKAPTELSLAPAEFLRREYTFAMRYLETKVAGVPVHIAQTGTNFAGHVLIGTNAFAIPDAVAGAIYRHHTNRIPRNEFNWSTPTKALPLNAPADSAWINPPQTNIYLKTESAPHQIAESSSAEFQKLTNSIQPPPMSLARVPVFGERGMALITTPKAAVDLILNRNFIPTSNLEDIVESGSRSLFIDVGGASVRVPNAAADLVFNRQLSRLENARPKQNLQRQSLPDKAPRDETWLNPFGPLTTKAAKAAQASAELALANLTSVEDVRNSLNRLEERTVRFEVAGGNQQGLIATIKNMVEVAKVSRDFPADQQVKFLKINLRMLSGLPTFRTQMTNVVLGHMLGAYSGQTRQKVYVDSELPDDVPTFDINTTTCQTRGEAALAIAETLGRGGFRLFAVNSKEVVCVRKMSFDRLIADGPKMSNTSVRRYALLYTYSLIIALVCGTAGLPHILVRFYTNPDGVAAKRTTMWVMILIGVFYLFPPIFGVMGRNLLPELYAGAGAKGTDKVVLELPRILNQASQRGENQSLERRSVGASERAESERSTRSDAPHAHTFPWGSILSGITCAGAFAAFMSTFSGLLVSMTGALAHDVYGRMLRPKSTPEQRMRAFRICAVIVGAVAILLGMQVEPFQINFMVGQAFAIAAASYFPLLFMSAWWRGMTMKGAATGMLTGGTLALAGISLTSFSDLKWLPLDAFWAAHPLVRILCEQPAIWTVPLAITLMVIVSKLTKHEVPKDIRMKMLVLHAPEKLGLKQEYIQEHQHGH